MEIKPKTNNKCTPNYKQNTVPTSLQSQKSYSTLKDSTEQRSTVYFLSKVIITGNDSVLQSGKGKLKQFSWLPFLNATNIIQIL